MLPLHVMLLAYLSHKVGFTPSFCKLASFIDGEDSHDDEGSFVGFLTQSVGEDNMLPTPVVFTGVAWLPTSFNHLFHLLV